MLRLPECDLNPGDGRQLVVLQIGLEMGWVRGLEPEPVELRSRVKLPKGREGTVELAAGGGIALPGDPACPQLLRHRRPAEVPGQALPIEDGLDAGAAAPS